MIDVEKLACFYNKSFPKYPPLVTYDGWLYGYWVMGRNYKGSGYYGAYPPAYLKRVMAMFPNEINILHLFSGSLNDGVKGDRFDIREELEPDVVGDANNLSTYVDKKYSLIIADPPYSEEDALHYGKPMISRNKVLSECVKVMKPQGIIVWLDQVLPMFRKIELSLFGTIGLSRSTNHRVRTVFMFEKVGL